MTAKRTGKKGMTAGRLFSCLLGFACALVLIAIFYGAMVYQLGGEQAIHSDLSAGVYPALGGARLMDERQQEVLAGGENCLVVTRTYELSGGGRAQLTAAEPAAYMGLLAEEKWEAQMVTGFTLAGLDAVYMTRGGEGLLAARDGDRVYLLIAEADEAALYALGAGTYLE